MFDLLASEMDEPWEPDADELFRLTVAGDAMEDPDDRHYLPRDLEEVRPGRYLAAILSSVDRAKLSGHDVVRLLQADARIVSHFNARLYADLCDVAHAYDPDSTARDSHPVEFAPEEVQAALCKTRRAAEMELELAVDLQCRMPRVWEALDQGDIDLGRARVFARELESLHSDLVPRAVDSVLSEASGLTTGQLRSRVQRIALELDPEAAEDRFHAGVEDRAWSWRRTRITPPVSCSTTSTRNKPCWRHGTSTALQ